MHDKPSKRSIIASIQSARAELEKTIGDIERLPAMDPANVSFTAHALSNFLTVSTGCIALLRERLHSHPDTDVQTWLEGLQHATTLMTSATHGMMTASVATGMRFRRESVDLETLVERACDFYQRLAGKKEIEIEFHFEGQHAEAYTDRVAISAVLDNLLSNAVKYSEPDKRIWVQLREQMPNLVCSVRDEGPGLSSEDRAQLFTRGARLSNRPTGGENSTGYGLAVAKEILDQLDGRIWCESEPGKGASFEFSIPATPR